MYRPVQKMYKSFGLGCRSRTNTYRPAHQCQFVIRVHASRSRLDHILIFVISRCFDISFKVFADVLRVDMLQVSELRQGQAERAGVTYKDHRTAALPVIKTRCLPLLPSPLPIQKSCAGSKNEFANEIVKFNMAHCMTSALGTVNITEIVPLHVCRSMTGNISHGWQGSAHMRVLKLLGLIDL